MTNSRVAGPSRAEAAQLITIYRKKIYVPLQTPIIRSHDCTWNIETVPEQILRTSVPNFIVITTTLVYKALLCRLINGYLVDSP